MFYVRCILTQNGTCLSGLSAKTNETTRVGSILPYHQLVIKFLHTTDGFLKICFIVCAACLLLFFRLWFLYWKNARKVLQQLHIGCNTLMIEVSCICDEVCRFFCHVTKWLGCFVQVETKLISYIVCTKWNEWHDTVIALIEWAMTQKKCSFFFRMSEMELNSSTQFFLH